MARPKRPDFNPPADLLSRLSSKPIITVGDKLAALQTMFHRCEVGWRDLHLTIINAIREDIRLSAWRKREQAQKDSAPVVAEAPSKTGERTEQGSSIPPKALERKIVTAHGCTLLVTPRTGVVALDLDAEPLDLTPDEARQLAAVLLEAAGDVDRDAAVREHYAQLVNTTG